MNASFASKISTCSIRSAWNAGRSSGDIRSTRLTSKKATATNDPEITTELQRQVRLARQTPEKDRSLFQLKVLELDRKYNFYMVLATSFRSPPLSADEKQIAESWQNAQNIIAQLNEAGAPTWCRPFPRRQLDNSHAGRVGVPAEPRDEPAAQSGHRGAQLDARRLRPRRRGHVQQATGRLSCHFEQVRTVARGERQATCDSRRGQVGDYVSTQSRLRGLLQSIQPVLLRGGAVCRRVRAGHPLVGRLDAAAATGFDLAAVVHVRAPHVRARLRGFTFRAGRRSPTCIRRRSSSAGPCVLDVARVRVDSPARPGKYRGRR